MSPWERLAWSTPPLDRLPAPALGRARTVGLVILRSYLALAGIALVVELVRLA